MGGAVYQFRGRLLRSSSFDILDPAGALLFRARPPALVGSGISLFSPQGQELVACRNNCSFTGAYLAGRWEYAFMDIVTGRSIGGLRGERENSDPHRVRWQIVDPEGMKIGHVAEHASPPRVRFGGKPMRDVMTGFVGGVQVFSFTVDTGSLRFRMVADFSFEPGGVLDRLLGLALATIFAAMKRTVSNDT